MEKVASEILSIKFSLLGRGILLSWWLRRRTLSSFEAYRSSTSSFSNKEENNQLEETSPRALDPAKAVGGCGNKTEQWLPGPISYSVA